MSSKKFHGSANSRFSYFTDASNSIAQFSVEPLWFFIHVNDVSEAYLEAFSQK